MKPQIELSGSSSVNKVFDVFVSIIVHLFWKFDAAIFPVHIPANATIITTTAVVAIIYLLVYFVLFKWALIWSPPSHSLPHTLRFHKNILWPFSYCWSAKWYILHLSKCMFAPKIRKYSRNEENPRWNGIIV